MLTPPESPNRPDTEGARVDEGLERLTELASKDCCEAPGREQELAAVHHWTSSARPSPGTRQVQVQTVELSPVPRGDR